MGRELRRKQAKKEGKSLKREEIEENNPIKKLLIIIGVLIFIGCVIYLLAAIFVTKEVDWFSKKETTEEKETTTVSDSILANAIFKQSEELYYVYFYDFDNKDEDRKLDTITSTIESALANYKVYRVDTGSAMNSKYITTEKGNKSAKNLSELKVISPTLIKIEREEIAEYYENDEITGNFS